VSVSLSPLGLARILDLTNLFGGVQVAASHNEIHNGPQSSKLVSSPTNSL
jgi:hypothetical protein